MLSRTYPSIGDQLLGIIELVADESEQARSLTLCEAAIEQVAEKAQETSHGHWVLGGGWNNNLWSPPDFPTRRDLDRVAPNNPVLLDRKDTHSCWVNSLALQRAGSVRKAQRLLRRMLSKAEHVLAQEENWRAVERMAAELLRVGEISGRAARHLYEECCRNP